MEMTTPSKQLICVSNPYQTTVNYQTYVVFQINQNYFNIPDKYVAWLWWPLIEGICQ